MFGENLVVEASELEPDDRLVGRRDRLVGRRGGGIRGHRDGDIQLPCFAAVGRHHRQFVDVVAVGVVRILEIGLAIEGQLAGVGADAEPAAVGPRQAPRGTPVGGVGVHGIRAVLGITYRSFVVGHLRIGSRHRRQVGHGDGDVPDVEGGIILESDRGPYLIDVVLICISWILEVRGICEIKRDFENGIVGIANESILEQRVVVRTTWSRQSTRTIKLDSLRVGDRDNGRRTCIVCSVGNLVLREKELRASGPHQILGRHRRRKAEQQRGADDCRPWERSLGNGFLACVCSAPTRRRSMGCVEMWVSAAPKFGCHVGHGRPSPIAALLNRTGNTGWSVAAIPANALRHSFTVRFRGNSDRLSIQST